MIDNHTQMVKALSTVLPTHYEMTLTKGTRTPCISYMETNNSVEVTSNIIGYSRITYQIKVWGNDISELQKYALQIDDALRPLSWKRLSAGELYDRNSTMIQKIMSYENLIKETF